MSGTTIFFIAFSAVIALVGLFAGAMAHDYLQFFGFALFAFGVLFGYSCVKRHYDAQDAARH
ncbi:hypothetical protein [Roseicella aerolata]|uniref:Uncharacterized protein n=1 Tax=Roseicella aerolata TaxID=2883479 RepID=A0A9X1ICE2_9PROT|nr:hypothetical protein [Roseicella aerolata]MCB4822261.1 hypothetical protein [Roseicella aerolata]